MKSSRMVCSALIFLLTGYAVVAAGQSEGGFYLGSRVGGGFLDTPKERDRPGSGLKDFRRTSLVWSIFGGHQWSISPRLLVGAEVGYTSNGNATITYASDNEYKFKSTEIDFLGTLTYVTNAGLFGSVKAGIGRTREQYGISDYVSGTPDINSEKTMDLFVAALNVGYRLSNGMGIFVDVRRTFGDRSDTVSKALKSTNPTPPPYEDMLNSVARVDAITLGFFYIF